MSMKPAARSIIPLIALLSAPAGDALAHPHVWVSVRSEIQFRDDKLAGVVHRWQFDEMYSAFAVEGLDVDGDGTYSRAELSELAKTNVEGLKEFSYFTRFQVEGVEQPLAEPTDYYLERADNGILTLVFTLPLAAPVAVGTLETTMTVADDTFYVAFNYVDDQAVTLARGTANGCAAKILPPSPEEIDLGAAFGSLGEGDTLTAQPMSQTVKLTCAAS